MLYNKSVKKLNYYFKLFPLTFLLLNFVINLHQRLKPPETQSHHPAARRAVPRPAPAAQTVPGRQSHCVAAGRPVRAAGRHGVADAGRQSAAPAAAGGAAPAEATAHAECVVESAAAGRRRRGDVPGTAADHGDVSERGYVQSLPAFR